jgi:hypothetical protein
MELVQDFEEMGKDLDFDLHRRGVVQPRFVELFDDIENAIVEQVS